MNNFDHVLTQEGILTAFSVSHKLSEKEMKELIKKFEKTHGKEKAEAAAKAHVARRIAKAVEGNKIPGMIVEKNEDEVAEENLKKNLPEGVYDTLMKLNNMVMAVAVKLMEKKLDKFSLCYFVNTLVNALNLSEKDFERFHKDFSKYQGEEDEGDEGDDYEDDDDEE